MFVETPLRRAARRGSRALVALLVGCSAADDPEFLDSVPTRSATLEIRVGSLDDPEYSLTYFGDIEVGPDGTMYTLHAVDREVRMFSADGTSLSSFAGEGDGPGELQNASSMGWVGDTLWVLDTRGYRFNQYDPSGAFLGSFMVPFEFAERGEAGPPRARGLLTDGTVHGAVPAWSSMVADGTLTHEELVLLRRDGTVQQALPRIRFGRNLWAIRDPDAPEAGGMYRPQPFSDGPLWSYLEGERALLVLEREAAESPEPDVFLLTKVSFEGDTVWAREYPYAPEPLPTGPVDSILDEVSAGIGERGFLGATEATARQWASIGLHLPDFRPPVADMVPARDGSIWLSLGPGDGGDDAWFIVDHKGEPVATTSLPSGLDILLIDPPMVYARDEDDLDVPYLVRYRVE